MEHTPAATVLSKKTAHTPGPWETITLGDEVPALAVMTQDRQSIFTVVHEDDIPFAAVLEDADARLIAAAPDLLAMVCHLVFFHDQLQRDDIARANALIAKATGVRLPVGSGS